MEALVQMFGGAATLIAVLGGAMATIFFAWAGIQWMMASGDPQKIGQARMALIGAAIGLVIVGAAFIVPEVISERIVEPAGGTAIENSAGLSCDRVLRNQLVFQRAASSQQRMNAVIKQIQAQRSECAADIWAPEIVDATADCGTATIGDTDVPRGLQQDRSDPASHARLASGRDSENNVSCISLLTISRRTAQNAGSTRTGCGPGTRNISRYQLLRTGDSPLLARGALRRS